MKKLASLALTIIMVLALAVPAFAADTTVTINGGNEGATYSAYQIMSLVQSGDNYAYTVSSEWKADLVQIAGITTDGKTDAAINNEIVEYVADQSAAADIRALAEELFEKIDGKSAQVSDQQSGFTVPQGYYLIVETSKPGIGATKSLVMLDTAGNTNVTITSKRETVTVEKKSDGKESVTANIGDHVPFTITATIPSNVALYDTYWFVIHDKLSAGLTYDADSAVVKVDGADVTDDVTVTAPATADDELLVVLSQYITDNKATLGGKTVTVEYTATLNSNAVIDAANPNDAYIVFSNDPYHSAAGGPADPDDPDQPGDPSDPANPDDPDHPTGETPHDKVDVFTFDIDIFKYTGADQPLAGAEFQLTKTDGGKTYYATASGTEGNYKITGWTETAGDATKFVSPASGNIAVDGLKDGTYQLTETKAPAGYNLLANSIVVVIASDGKVTVGGQDATQIKVENMSGNELPSTGGIGTTIFYTMGGLLAVGAAVLLVTKKRVHDAEA